MLGDFPTGLENNNNYNNIFDIDLNTDEEKIIYYSNILNKKIDNNDMEGIIYISKILNNLMVNNDE